MKVGNYHLSYCTNIHPAETWKETLTVLKTYPIRVRDTLILNGDFKEDEPFAIGLRLSAEAAAEVVEKTKLTTFKAWLDSEDCYIYTINGFPYGEFHGVSVKENAYKPDWTTPERLNYTKQLITIIAEICPVSTGGSVSTLPGSFKEFNADENLIFENLYEMAQFIEQKSKEVGKDLHLGLEPEPLGHFETTEETIAFFYRFKAWAESNELSTKKITRYIGVNFDTCHIAMQFEDPVKSLQAFSEHEILISKIHLSNALEITPTDTGAISAIREFNESTYLHQLILRKENGELIRLKDLPDSYNSYLNYEKGDLARIHFHIPLYQEPPAPLRSTSSATDAVLSYIKKVPNLCKHIEMETYTWGVLPEYMQKDIFTQLAAEYRWTLSHE